jgi:hypothetical protein
MNDYESCRESFVKFVEEYNGAKKRNEATTRLQLSTLATWTGAGTQNGFVETELFYERLQSFGYTPDQIDNGIIRAYKHKLLELSGRRTPEPGSKMPPSIRATSVGVYHAEKLTSSFSYVDAVIVDVPVFEKEVREKIRDAQSLDERLFRAEAFCSYLDRQWKQMNSDTAPYRWPGVSQAIRSEIERIRSRNVAS